MKLPKLRELKEAIRALIKGPYTSEFPRVAHKPHKNFRGQPKFNQDKCVGCLACEEVCPVGAIDHIDITDDGGIPRRIMVHYTDTCIFCGQCEAVCIAEHEGIKLSDEWELSFFDRKNESSETIEKELQLCEICGRSIACKDHLKWIADKLGELTYSSPTLYLSRLKSLGIVDENIVSVLKSEGRSDRVKILCASCRRKTTLTTEE
ncbi:MAG: 4Fe-4S dicluster domain-containing protein [Candidatus Omnitrophica bacterium]|nr:4Fe-4S dicluster domain-containing protein [Candidatus Omnitrophota bacterium]MBD3269861.1 4Fe-4S dicluster domain-containing protein [Candidatus Omnitrophota bacterium]